MGYRLFYSGTAKDGNGKVVTDATISVFLAGGSTAASIYTSLTSTSALNSTTSGSATSSSPGYWIFYTDAFDYDAEQLFKIAVSKAGFTTQTYDNFRGEVVLGTYTVSSALTVTTHVIIPKGVLFAKSGSGSIAFNGPTKIGLYQVFDSTFSSGITFGEGSVKEVHPEWWYSSGDYYTAVTSAIASHKRIAFTGNGKTYTISTKASLPNADREIIGYGYPVLDTAGTNVIFEQTNSGQLTRIKGINFTGGGAGFQINATAANRSYFEYDISDCIFNMDSGIYGVRLIGAGEGHISHSKFGGGSSIVGNGIYAKQSDFRIIDNCEIVGCAIGIFDDGTRGTDAYSTGTYLINSIVMNCTIGINSKLSEDFQINNSTVDYNDTNILIEGNDCGKIIGNYLGDRGGNPAIELKASGATLTEKFKIIGNDITGHYVDADTYTTIKITDTLNTKIVNNSITFYHLYGIQYHGDTDLLIQGNNINPRVTKGTASIYTDDDDSTVKILDNDLGQTISGISTAQIRYNKTYYTEYNGTAAIEAGNTSVTITHNLSFTPTVNNIMAVPQNTWGNATKWWIENPTSTTFDISCDIAPGGVGFYFTWWVKKNP